MTLLLSSLVCTLIQLPSLLLRFVPFKMSITKNQKLVLGIIYTAVLVLNLLFWLYSFNCGLVNMTLYKYNLTGVSLLLTAVNILVIKGRFQEHLFVSGTEFLLGQVLIILVNFGEQFFNIKVVFQQITVHAVAVTVAYILFYPVFRKLLIGTVTPFLELETGSYWKTIWQIPFAIYFATTIAYLPDSPITTPSQLIAQLFLVVATVFICRSVASDSLGIREKIEFSEQLGRQKEYYSALSERVMEIRKIKHDAKHHNDALRYYIDKKDKEGLYQYCKEMIHQVNDDIQIPYSGNSAVDGLLYRYMELAQKNDITFNVSGALADIDISDVDICVLLGNALDNAITGCLTAPGERFISLSVRKDGGALTIMIQNSFDGIVDEKENKIFSRKRYNEPGIGLFSMKSICKKYGGEMEVRYEDNVFSVLFYNL